MVQMKCALLLLSNCLLMNRILISGYYVVLKIFEQCIDIAYILR